ncbi:MAG: D-sedoheptulose 7-phosphate isomerase [Desulfobacterales bacterium]|nr:D-sedoheptulose 7-phosphate isomerase [Desulfobacterales bacterium]
MKAIIEKILADSIAVKERFISSHIDEIIKTATLLADCIAAGNKIMLFGNGGSAADAQHIAAEFVNRFEIERRPLAALALTTDTSVITSIGNDYHFDDIFSKQVRALGRKGDVSIGISTSGNSPNVIKAIAISNEMGIHTVGLSGPGGQLKSAANLPLCVASDTTARIQEAHALAGHILCLLTDRILFPELAPR